MHGVGGGTTDEPTGDSASPSFDEAVERFLDYVGSYRGYSRLTVRAYACDLRQFREFAETTLGRAPALGEVTRELIIQFGVHLKGAAAPLRGRILDPFAGSGSTVIAVEGSGCTWLAGEIVPRRCDIVAARCEALSGEKAAPMRR